MSATELTRAAPRSWRLPCVGLMVTILLLCASSRALASPVFEVTSLSNTTAIPGRTFTYLVLIRNVSNDFTDGSPLTATVTLPSGMLGVSASGEGFDCPGAVGVPVITCTNGNFLPPRNTHRLTVTASVDPGAAGVGTASFEAAGGGALLPASTVDPVRISPVPPEFGVDAFDAAATADASGNPLTQAGGHPYALTTSIDFNTHTDPSPVLGDLWPVELVKDAVVNAPPGLVGNPTGLSQCTTPELSNSLNGFIARPLCPPTSQVGTMLVRTQTVGGPLPVFNMVPPPDVPARFGVNIVGSVVVLDAEVRSGGDYGINVRSSNIPEALAIAGTTVTLWGVPADPSHDGERACPGGMAPAEGGPTCINGGSPTAFLRNPTSCTPAGSGLLTTAQVDSWEDPGDFKQASFVSHDPPGYPFAPLDWGPEQGIDRCGSVPFDPVFSAEPLAGSKAGAPSAMAFDITMPQTDSPASIGQSDLRRVTVTLPVGVRVSPGSANGLQVCSPAQIALRSSVDASCPAASHLATAVIDTPLLDEQVKGSVYLAKPFDNPFGSLVAIYLVARAHGVVLKLPGRASMDADTGQITTTFDDNPQLPFSRLHLEFDSGPRAALTMPKQCGTYTTRARLEGWSGSVVNWDSSFTLTENARGEPCPSTFTPGFSAGTASNSAGASSSFLLRLTRDDEDQELKSLTVHLPNGLTGKPADVPLCGEADAQAGTCPEATRVGSVTVGSGAGTNPFFITNGRAYWTGPYKGAPFGLSIVVPAIAGPFDLGTVVVRSAIYVDKHDATVRIVSDRLPRILEGIPLDVRDVRVNVDRRDFFVNPTSCAEKHIDATVESLEGTVANVSDRFQAADCASLALKPKMQVAVGAKGRTGRGASTPFSTTLTMPAGGANLRFVRVTLPTTINARLPVINKACTRVQFESGHCDGSRAGTVVAKTPLLRDPLRGNVYFVRNGNPLPDLFIALRGQIDFDLTGKVTIPNGKRLSTTIAAVPDVPITSFALHLVSGRQGPIGAATNLCSKRGRNAKVELDFIGQNGKVKQVDQHMRIRGCGKQHKARRHGGRH